MHLRRHTTLAASLLAGIAALAAPAAAQTKVTIVTFAGVTNIGVWAGVEKGFFAKEGLDVTHEITRGSSNSMRGLMEGKYHFASAALDNTVAIKEGQGDVKFDNFDVVAILGVHSGMAKIVARPEIKRLEDIKGKAIASDALNSGYGLVLVKVLAGKGLTAHKDYTAVSVGSTPNRIKAMQEGKAVAAMISPPEHVALMKQGYNLLGDATAALGAYQGSAVIVRQSWAKANEKAVLSFIRAQVAATEWVFKDKAGAIALMKTRLKNMPDAEVESAYVEMTTSKGGLNPGARINAEGVKTLLALRNELSGSSVKLTDASRYIDTSYYTKAVGAKK